MADSGDTIFQPENTPRVAVITGFLGAGKTTLAELLQTTYNDQLKRVVTYTTRPPREGEIHGTHYHFIDEPQFHELREKGHFFETNQLPTGFWYATPHFKTLEADPEQVLLYVIDPNGALHFKKNHPDTEAFFLYVSPEEQYRRLTKERADDDTVEKRLSHYQQEHSLLKEHEPLFHILRNEEPDDLQQAHDYFRRTFQL